jgi:ribosomal protein L7Ae-like RNA K-turn-binding protein
MSEARAILYKLTDKDGYTRRAFWNALKWEVGCTHAADGDGKSLCSPDLIHAYTDPYMAVIMNSAHAGFKRDSIRMFKASGVVIAEDGQRKVGVKRLTILEEMPLPVITVEQKDEITIRVLLGTIKFPHIQLSKLIDWSYLSELCVTFLAANSADRQLVKETLTSYLKDRCIISHTCQLIRDALKFDSCIGLGLFLGYYTELNLDFISIIHETIGA